jgi:integrase
LKKGKKYGITENVVLDAEYGRVDKFKATILTAEEVKYVLHYITRCEKDYSVFCLFGIPALAGLRRGEVCGLRWMDIDFENKLIDVMQQRAQIGSETIVKVPKMGNDDGKDRYERRQRYVALPDALAFLLQKVKEQQTEIVGKPPRPEDYVYRTKMNIVRGELPRPGKVSKRFKELLIRCNKVRENNNLEPLPLVRMHDMRHTFISLCINGNVSPLKVSANCGHDTKEKNESTTTKVYWQDDKDRTEILEFLNNLYADVTFSIPDLSE